MDGSENTGEALRDGYVYVAEGFDASIWTASPEVNGADNGGIASSSSEISSIPAITAAFSTASYLLSSQNVLVAEEVFTQKRRGSAKAVFMNQA
jgi:hypothetical protein